ncbi:iron complex transport system substrate-binding protein [Microbacteriaceae bacterium SG_E_30_P1]|uniref:Iron complex transport system substrate-binding protein n=1 Tax=Antiquaquibacter oligotrophicus TaxID=2880260 RepID=A0ABT6KJH2_9MICO|nr:ABC transporter substrate-binding protein [Antiquaquibacter oligotrophicus]MDH6180138.1 iron complex transport system substrate-binding protein [Antiquaquibacter oligotrophicus]UDF14110.1 ABC transporter substrate-binding protein [Antiquaquibacter oligotrophicus]
MLTRTSAFLALGAVVITALAGCTVPASPAHETPVASSAPAVPLADLDILEDPRSYVGESTAVLADRSLGTAPAPEQSLPVTVTSRDLDGETTVTVNSTERIVAMDIAGSIASTVAALGLGDKLVGRDISTTAPELADLPLVTSNGHTVNAEAILALRPDIVITDGTIGPIDVVLQLREAGVSVVFVENEPSLAGVGELARQVGETLGASDAGEALAETLDAEIQAKITEIAEIVPGGEPLRMLFLYLRGNSGIYYLFGGDSGADVLIESLGGIDVAAELGFEGQRPMTDEAMVAANPDLIFVMTAGIESVGGVDGLLQSKPAIGLTAAGQHRRFVDMADGDILSFGPRTAGVLDALARAVYAPE